MSTTAAELIIYPESDGKPMGETDLHQEWMIRIKDILKRRYRNQNVYVASDLLIYYEQHTPARYIVPDNFVVLDCPAHRRRIFKVWEENRVPDFVIEVTSKGTRREDELFKPTTYAMLGVKEYFLYDPTAEYLRPPLQGHRLNDQGLYDPIRETSGRLRCQTLGLELLLEDNDLVLLDVQSGERQLTGEEAEHQAWIAESEARKVESEARKVESEARKVEAEARKAAEARVAELEAKLRHRNGH